MDETTEEANMTILVHGVDREKFQKIAAIKAVRADMRLGLVLAKEIVEKFAAMDIFTRPIVLLARVPQSRAEVLTADLLAAGVRAELLRY